MDSVPDLDRIFHFHDPISPIVATVNFDHSVDMKSLHGFQVGQNANDVYG